MLTLRPSSRGITGSRWKPDKDKGRKKTKGRFSWLCSRFSLTLGLGLLSIFNAIPAWGAERIAFLYPPFGEFYISVEDLEIFAKEGRITPEFAFYARRATPEQLAQLRDLLQQRFEVSPITVYQFTRSPIGETVLRRLGLVLKADFNRNGFYPLRAALRQAAADSEGLTVINTLRQFPLKTIRLDLQLSLDAVREISRLLEQRDLVIATIQQQAASEAATAESVGVLGELDLRLPGVIRWRKETLTFTNPNRTAPVPFDIYLPTPLHPSSGREGTGELTPLIVISHGVASDRNTFAYLAQHLASHGFAVAVLEHPDTSAEKFERFLAGFDTPPDPTTFVNRPLDVKYLLDELAATSESELAWPGRLNLQEVGVIGQSLGGYTVLALGGAQLNIEQLREQCRQAEANNLTFNLSLLLQCRATDLPSATYNFQDERVKAVIAVNPLSSAIFGQQGLSSIQVPLMLVAGSDDVFTPPVPEQFYPFTGLTTPDKYLVLAQNGTHFSFLSGKNKGALPVPPELIGPDPTLARRQLTALSTAFFKTHIANQPEFRPYLSESYIKSISQDPFNLTLVRFLTETQLEQARRVGTN